MARPVNSQCDRCYLMEASEARLLHGAGGDGCWDELRCHNRRSYYRHRHDRLRNRRQVRRDNRSGALLSLDTPAAAAAVLYLYGSEKSRLGLGEAKTKIRTPHALGAQLWMHQRRIAQIETVHCLGWSSQQLDAYVRQILATFERSYSVTMENFSTVVERPVDCCPIRPCPLLG